jgi:hypothetical protein
MRRGDEDVFTIGKAEDFNNRRTSGGMARYGPNLKKYRMLRHSDPKAVEHFLEQELAGCRQRDIESKSWYLASAETIDDAIDCAKRYANACIANKKRRAELKNVQTNGGWLIPTERLQLIHAELTRIKVELEVLRRDEARLKDEAMAAIGLANGIEGLFAWASKEKPEFDEANFATANPELYQKFLKRIYIRNWKIIHNKADGTICEEEDLDE